MQSVIDIRKQQRGVMKKCYTEKKSRNKTRRVCEEDDCYLDEYRPFKRSRRQVQKDKILSLQVIILYLKENYFMWCKEYGNKQMHRIDILLWHITGRSSIMNQQMKLMCQPTFGPYLRINIQLPDIQFQGKSSLGQDENLSLTFIKIAMRKKQGQNYQKQFSPLQPCVNPGQQ